MRDLARRVARRSYSLTKWRLLRRLGRQQGTPIVVFCMSKTASSALVRAVRTAVPNPVFKVHMLAADSIARSEADYRRTDRNARPRHLFHAAHLVHRLPTPEHPWIVVTIVREPVARSASEFFQSAERLGRLSDGCTTTRRFETFASRQGIPRTVSWFDDEFKPSIGVDVYEQPFDPVLGYGVIQTAAARVLVLRQESLAVAGEALGQFLGLPGKLEIARENAGSDKAYSELYAGVIRDAHLPKAALDAAYCSGYSRHFYSSEEIDGFQRSWEHKEPTQSTPGS